MGLFDSLKDAFTIDDGERLDAARKELGHLEQQLQHAKDANNIDRIADLQSKVDAARGQIADLERKTGQAVDAPVDTPVAEPMSDVTTDVTPEPEVTTVPDTPVIADPTPVTPEPTPVTPEPTPVTPEPTPAATPAAPAAPAAPEQRTYTVKPGDTLSAIGREFGVTYQEIAKLNNIENPDLIYPGQVFKIPNN